MDQSASPGCFNSSTTRLPLEASTPISCGSSSSRGRLLATNSVENLTDSGSPTLLESSLEDVSEEQLIGKFLAEGCGCRYGPKSSQCCYFLERALINKCRQDCLQLDSDELDLVVLSCIHCHLSLPDQPTQRVSNHRAGEGIETCHLQERYFREQLGLIVSILLTLFVSNVFLQNGYCHAVRFC